MYVLLQFLAMRAWASVNLSFRGLHSPLPVPASMRTLQANILQSKRFCAIRQKIFIGINLFGLIFVSDSPLLHSDGGVNDIYGEECGLTVRRAETGMAWPLSLLR